MSLINASCNLTYIGSSPPTSCPQFQESTWVCAHTPVVHLAKSSKMGRVQRFRTFYLHFYERTVQKEAKCELEWTTLITTVGKQKQAHLCAWRCGSPLVSPGRPQRRQSAWRTFSLLSVNDVAGQFILLWCVQDANLSWSHLFAGAQSRRHQAQLGLASVSLRHVIFFVFMAIWWRTIRLYSFCSWT